MVKILQESSAGFRFKTILYYLSRDFIALEHQRFNLCDLLDKLDKKHSITCSPSAGAARCRKDLSHQLICGSSIIFFFNVAVIITFITIIIIIIYFYFFFCRGTLIPEG